ncbi:[F-actin]-monooxygenase MICAL3 [Plecturocebus cupreus]
MPLLLPCPLPDQHWADSPSEADRELHLQHPANREEPELRVPEDEEKPMSPKQHERGEPVGDERNSFQHSCKSHVRTRVAQGPAIPEQSGSAHRPPRCRQLLASPPPSALRDAGSSLPFLLCPPSLCHRLLQMLWPTVPSLHGLGLGEGRKCILKLCVQSLHVKEAHALTWSTCESAGQPREDGAGILTLERTCAFRKSQEQTQRLTFCLPLHPLGLAETGPSQATSPIRSPQESALLFTPVHSPSTEGLTLLPRLAWAVVQWHDHSSLQPPAPGLNRSSCLSLSKCWDYSHEPLHLTCSLMLSGSRLPPVPAATQEKPPEERFFPEPVLPKEKPKADAPSDPRAVHSPIRSQPVALPEARTPASPGSPQPRPPLAASTPPPSPLPICSQPQPSTEATIPSPTQSPIRFQPVPAKASTPLAPLPVQSQGDPKDRLGSPLAVDEALRRSDLVEEFWMKSAEIRRSLGLTPVDRSKGPQPSFPTPAFRPVSLKSYSVEKSPQDEGLHLLKPLPVPKRTGLPKLEGELLSLPTPRSPSDRELRSAQEDRRELSSSSGLGLHGSSSNMKTLGSQSFNTSDSTMLTPPSSPPPPPPPGEEPATLRRKLREAEPHASVVPPPSPAAWMRPPREPAQPPREEVRKSFVESVEEIPFADDVEDTYDDKTEDLSLQEKFFTPPSCWPHPEKPPHPSMAKENGRLPALEGALQPQKRGLPLVSAEAKELAEERMRAREKSVKSQALRDAMARQLSRMQQMELATGAPRPRKASSAPSQGKERRPDSPARPTLRGSEEPTLKHEATSEEVLSPPSDSGGPDGSFTSSEGSSGKSKKRSSLFSPRRNKKEKKSKGETRPPEKPSPSLPEEAATKPKSLWKSVFSGYKKDKKKKADDKSCPSTPSSGATVDSSKHRALPVVRAELQLRRQLSFSEDSDLSSDDVLDRSSQKSRREVRSQTGGLHRARGPGCSLLGFDGVEEGESKPEARDGWRRAHSQLTAD